MRSNWLLALIELVASLFIVVACAGPTASTAGAPAEVDLSGEWTGECFGCAARTFTLVLAQAGRDVTGTIKTEGTPNFGDSAKPILEGAVSGRKLAFHVKGDPGDLFDVELTASLDGKTLSGTGHYRSSFGLRFTRSPR